VPIDEAAAITGARYVPRAPTSAQARVDKESASRAAFEQGEFGLDRYGLRDKLPEFGIEYLSYGKWAEGER